MSDDTRTAKTAAGRSALVDELIEKRNVVLSRQGRRIVESLIEGPKSSFFLRYELMITNPSARIKDLKNTGLNIICHMGPLRRPDGTVVSACTYELQEGGED